MGRPLHVGVIGAGYMGSNHARIYSELKGVELVGVFDPDTDRAGAVAAQFGGVAFATLNRLGRQIDAATVAVPSALHAEVAGELLASGVSCLVEKPLAMTAEDCRMLIEAARRHDAVLMVGHVERFNPVVPQLGAMVRGRKIHAIDVRRMSRLSSRIGDVDVIADLMIHDIDIVLALMDDDVAQVFAHGVRSHDRAGDDHATAILSFTGGAMACLTASRIAHNKIRELHVMTDEEFITANYSTQELLVHRQRREPMPLGRAGAASYVLDLAIERVLIRAAEPLAVEIRHFVDAVVNNTAPMVSGEDALRALELAWRVREQLAGQGLSVRA